MSNSKFPHEIHPSLWAALLEVDKQGSPIQNFHKVCKSNDLEEKRRNCLE